MKEAIGNKKSFWKQLIMIFRGYKIVNDEFTKPLLLSKALASIFNALTPFLNLYFSSVILNELIGSQNKDKLIELVLLTVSVNLVLFSLKSIINRWAYNNISYDYYILRNIYSKKMMSMDYSYIENPEIQEQLGDIKSHQFGVYQGILLLIRSFEALVQSFTQSVIALAIIFTMFKTRIAENSPYQFLDSNFVVLIFIFSLCTSIFLAQHLESIGYKVFEKGTLVHNKISRVSRFYNINFIYENAKAKDVRIYNQQDLIKDKYNSFKELLYINTYNAKWHSISNIVTNLFSGLVYLFVVLKAYAGAFGVGSIVLYVGVITLFVSSLSKFIRTLVLLKSNNRSLEKVFDFLEIPNHKYQGTLPVEKREDNEYEIEFRNVSFKYPKSEVYALKNLNMKLHIGQKVAIVGMNGSGKSTMIKLLCRLYDVETGVITLNGIDIKKYNYDEYMEIFAMVFQDFSLLPLKIGEIVASSVNYDKEYVTECLEKAGFGERLKTLPKGLDTFNTKAFDVEGIKLSGGESQKLALARAMYKNAPFIVLDEPTAALDPIAEYELYARFNEVVEDKTTIYISHRLSSCRFCDDIIVFDKGELIQRGSHEELILIEEGKYFELWHAQAQYYQ